MDQIPENTDVIFLRVTELNTYEECPAKFRFQSVEKVETPNKPVLALGNAGHEALRVNYSDKIITGKDLKFEDVADVFVTTLHEELSNCERADLLLLDPGKTQDQALKSLSYYMQLVAPRIRPHAVEQRIKVKFDDGKGGIFPYGLTGKIDVYDEDKIIVDHKFKTSKKSFLRKPGIDYKKQLGGGYFVLENSTGRQVKGARVDYIRIDGLPGHMPYNIPLDKTFFLNQFQEIVKGIQAESFPTKRGSLLCRRRYCKFWAECEKKYGGIVDE